MKQAVEKIIDELIINECPICGASLLNKEESDENWQCFKTLCLECGWDMHKKNNKS